MDNPSEEPSALAPGELELFVQSMEPTKIENIGISSWVEWHIRLQKLNQQAVVEANSMQEEQTKEALISFGKLPVLVHEAICIQVWRCRILPEMLKMELDTMNTFSIYMVLYHEAAAVGLLETVLFHEDGARALADVILDLFDYSAEMVATLLGLLNSGYLEYSKEIPSEDEEPGEEVERQRKDLSFDIGMRCISIVRYLAEHIDIGGAGLSGRMYRTHDIPSLFVHLLDIEPWKRVIKSGEVELFKVGTWTKPDPDELDKLHGTEAQLWLCLRQLLLEPRLHSYYSIDNVRKASLCRLQNKMTDSILDQIPPLIELKAFLCQLSVADTTNLYQPDKTKKDPGALLIEIVPQIKKTYLERVRKRSKAIARSHVAVLRMDDSKESREMAARIANTYTDDAVLDAGEHTCAGCGCDAPTRCSRCRSEWYCGRECQVKQWGRHKELCDQLSLLVTSGSQSD